MLSYAGDVGGALRAFEQRLLLSEAFSLRTAASRSFIRLHRSLPARQLGARDVERIRRRRYMLSNLQMIEEALRPCFTYGRRSINVSKRPR